MRLVEQEHGGVAGQRPGERDPLPLAAGELRRPRLREVGDPEPFEQLGTRGRGRRSRRSPPPTGAGRARTPGRRARRCAGRGRGRRPAGRVEPGGAVERDAARRGRSNPATTRSTVVLPAPDGPTSANVSPGSTLRSSAALEGAKRVVEGDVERHRKTTLVARRITALITTSWALIASARSKSRSNAS